VDLTTKDGETALNWATRHGNTNSISVLLKAHTKDLQNVKPSAGDSPAIPRSESNAAIEDPRHVFVRQSPPPLKFGLIPFFSWAVRAQLFR